MGIYLRYLLSVLLTFSSPTLVYYQFTECHIDFSVSCCEFDNRLGFFILKMRFIEVIHRPIWDIRIAVFSLSCVLELCVHI